MDFSKWGESNEVFLAPIDNEHRTIFDATAELQRALRGHAPLVEIREMLHSLIACAEDHFAHEEKLMRDARYRSFDWHKRQHDTARKRLGEYVPLIEDGDVDAGIALVDFLARWLDDHTAVTDRMMGAYLRNRDRAGIA